MLSICDPLVNNTDLLSALEEFSPMETSKQTISVINDQLPIKKKPPLPIPVMTELAKAKE